MKLKVRRAEPRDGERKREIRRERTGFLEIVGENAR